MGFKDWFANRNLKAAPVGRIPNGTAGGSSSSLSSIAFWGNGTLQELSGYDKCGPIDYRAEVGSILGNSAVAACLSWIITSSAACELQVGTGDGDKFVPNPGAPAAKLLAQPDPELSQQEWFAWLFADYFDTGNKIANVVPSGKTGPPVELQLIDTRRVTPYAEANAFRYIEEYRVQNGSGFYRLFPENVIHFRYHLPDTSNPSWGMPPLLPAIREIYTDNKASEVAAALMNSPRPSGVLSPDKDVDATETELDLLKRRASEATSGGNSGAILALGSPTRFTKISFDPSELALDESRRKPEERICALFGIPPVVVGLGAGLDKATYNNTAMFLRSAWNDCLIPLQDYLASTLEKRLQELYGDANLRLRWDRSGVEALQDSDDEQHKDEREDLKAGILTANEIRASRGLKPLPEPVTPPAPTVPAIDPADPSAKSLRLKREPVVANIYTAADRMRRALARNEADALDSLATEWEKAQAGIDAERDAVLSRLAQAEASGEAVSLYLPDVAARLESLAAQIEVQLSDLADRGAAITADAQRAAVDTTLSSSRTLAQVAVGTAPSASVSLGWNALPVEAFESLFGFASNGSPLSDLFNLAAGDYANEVRSGLLSAIAQGMNPRASAARLSAISGVSRARMETITRTEMLRASREASRRSYMANADVLEGWVRLSAADSRTCPACFALHGTKSAVSEIMPTHPNCRCVASPLPKSWADLLGDDSLPDTRPTIQIGAELFAALDEATQIEILGPGRYEQYAENPAVFASFASVGNDPAWGPTTRVPTLSETAR